MAEALTTRSDWLAAHPPARERLSETLGALPASRLSDDAVFASPEETYSP